MAATEQPNAGLRYIKDGHLAWIVADNPARMNALTAAMWQALPGHIATATADPEVRVVILRGAGDKAFSAGADISEFESARTGDAAKTYDALNDAAFTALTSCPKPVIAMIHGFCLGGGLGLAQEDGRSSFAPVKAECHSEARGICCSQPVDLVEKQIPRQARDDTD